MLFQYNHFLFYKNIVTYRILWYCFFVIHVVDFLERSAMKIMPALILLAATIMMAFPSISTASDLGSLDTTLRILQEQIARQIERVQAVRQKSDASISIARARMESQLKQAQEELTVQTEVLERLREQLRDKIKETDEKLASWKDQTSGVIGSTLSEISAQMNQTNDLMRRLELLKAQTSECNDQGAPTVAPLPSLPDLTTSAPPSPEPQPTQPDMPTLPLPEPTTITFAPPAPSG
jgi:uncharacterized phage infection (PIP) family protein YhgE